MLASLLLLTPPTPSYFPLLQSRTPSLHSSPPQTRTTTLHSARNNCFCLEGVWGGGKGGAHGSLCGGKGVCEGQPVTSPSSPSFSSLVCCSLFPSPPALPICLPILSEPALAFLRLTLSSPFPLLLLSPAPPSPPLSLDLQMSSVTGDAGEKDNKTCLSTADNGTFFIIKKCATFAPAHFWPFTAAS